MILYWILFIGIAVLSYAVQANLDRKFSKYSQMASPSGLTGREVAQQMLSDYGVRGVRITCIEGQLTDHYNPETNTVNLSKGVYSGRSIASAAVAAHECGHAVQHAKQYAPVRMRSAMVPVVQFASKWVTWVILAGILFFEAFPSIMHVGIVMFAMTTLFSFITLPVEIDASRRALAWLERSGVTASASLDASKDALKAAAYTYVVAALSSLGTLIYYIMIFNRRN